MKSDVKAILGQISNSISMKTKRPGSPEVIPLRTAVKRLPGRKLAIYVGVVITALILLFNLSIDQIFIWKCDKAWNDL